METKINYTAVGAFVILLTAAIIFGIIWLSSGFSVQQYEIYQVNMKESVSGLSIDAAVEFNGVNVGSVKSIEISHKDPQLVELLLNIDSDTPITEGTVAMLNMKGLTGIAYVALQDKGNNKKPLIAKEKEEYPIINTAPSFFLRLDTMLSKLNDNLHDVSSAVRDLLNKQNQEAIQQILANLERTTSILAKDSHELHAIVINTANATRDLKPLLQNSIDVMQSITTQTLPAANQMMNDLNITMRNIVNVTQQMTENPSVLLRGTTPSPLGPGEK